MKAANLTLIKIITFTVCTALFASCLSITDGAGRLLDGSLFAEKTASKAVVKDAAGTKVAAIIARDKTPALVITSTAVPNLKIYGTAPDENGRFQFTSAVFLCSTYNGWNEINYAVYGNGIYTRLDDGTGSLRFETPLEIIEIAKGSMRHGDSRLTAERAVVELRHRAERIDALIAWMGGTGNPFAHNADGAAFADKAAFAAYWRPRLMPELYSPFKRPPEYKQTVKSAGKPTYSFGEDVFWNKQYTEYIFPAHMHKLRDSGALLRDWEDALDWIYLKYIWKNLPDMLLSASAGKKASK
jgi:hypothetical protein